MDDNGDVVAETLTQNTVDDAEILPDLLGQIDAPLRRFTGDGAYDKRSVYKAVGEAGGTGVEIVVPPRRPAAASPKATGPWEQRNLHIERIAEIGRQAWQRETGYRQQARVEGTFLRYKRILGGSIRAKEFEAQTREATGGVHRAEQNVRARQGAVLRGHGVIVGDFDTGSVRGRTVQQRPMVPQAWLITGCLRSRIRTPS